MVQKINLKLAMVVVSTLVLVGASGLYAQDSSPPDATSSVKFYFRVGKTTLDRNFMGNSESLAALDKVLLSSSFLLRADSVIVRAGASPDGSYAGNVRLAQGRAQAIKNYMLRGSPELLPEKVKTHSRVTAWAELRPLAEQDPKLPHRAAVLSILFRHTNAADIENQLRGLGAGTVWKYICTHYLPRFRRGDADIVFYYEGKSATLDEVVEMVTAPPVMPPIIMATIPLPQPTEQPEVLLLATQPIKVVTFERHPLFAVKTNLMFDVASILNIEAEIPIGNRWSIAGEWIFPWWLWKRKQICLQLLSGNIEGRYWMGKRDNRPKLTGWFTGLYAGAGYYDLEWKTKGIQGESFVSIGVSAGYAHTINRSGTLRMEYALGVGYMQTEYREYKPANGGEKLMWQRDGRYSWINFTKAKVSLVWMINHKIRKGGTQ